MSTSTPMQTTSGQAPQRASQNMGFVVFLFGVAWTVLVLKQSATGNSQGGGPITDAVGIATPLLYIGLAFVFVGFAGIWGCRWVRVPTMVAFGLAVGAMILAGCFGALLLVLKITGACPFPV